MNWKRILISGVMGVTVFIGGFSFTHAQDITYKVKWGDTFWKISDKHKVDIYDLMKINGASQGTVLYPGQTLTIPGDNSERIHKVSSGETYWIISEKYGVDLLKLLAYNNANERTVINVGQEVKIPGGSINNISTNTTTYKSHKVIKGDDIWKLSQQYGIPIEEIMKANNLNQNSWLNIGDIVKIPVHNIPVKETPGDKFGEYLNWWTEAQYVVPVNAVFKVTDFKTGKSFMAKRTTGANHADSETLTEADTKKMKDIWGGFSWDRRAVILEYDGRKIAASMSGMPHAGNDNSPGGIYTSWRSDGYGAGTNFDWIKNNGMNGVFDIHFVDSTRHKDGEIDLKHQAQIKIAAGK